MYGLASETLVLFFVINNSFIMKNTGSQKSLMFLKLTVKDEGVSSYPRNTDHEAGHPGWDASPLQCIIETDNIF